MSGAAGGESHGSRFCEIISICEKIIRIVKIVKREDVGSSWWRITWQPVSQLSSRPIALLRHGESAKFKPFLQN